MRCVLFALSVVVLPMGVHAETIRLYAAGSLRAAMADIVTSFEAAAGGKTKVEAVYGASGLLRERIEKGEPAQVFASADTGHPKRLAEQGLAAAPVTIFARNKLCALVREGLDVTTERLLDVLLDLNVRLATSTPKADPSGDYAFALFGKAEALRAGAKAKLEAKALQLVGSPTAERAPEGKNLYGWLMASGKADVFLTYCTNAVQAKTAVPTLSIVAIPDALAIGADYGLVVLKGAPPAAHEFATFIRSQAGRDILGRHGFGAGE
ncbi:MAG: molybdate ABC transporter substrate-binding protein [Hyphomicrobiaceae bacterium]